MGDQSLIPQPSVEARRWAMLCHYAAFAWFIVPMVGNVIGPLIVWQLKKDLDPFVDQQGKEALNFQLTVSIALMVLVGVVALVLTVIAGIKANDGVAYRYPLCWRLVK